MYWGDYQGTHYSPLTSINPTNVARLRAAWSAPVPGDSASESTPLVVDGVMYATSGGNTRTVTAIDARTGRQIWRYTRQQKVRNPGETDVVNRGVAILGHRLFVGTNDAALVCLDARTGLPIWEVQVADTMEGFNITSPPLIVKDKIIVGHAGGEYALRGFLDAYDVDRQAAVAVPHDSRPWRVRPRHVERRQLEDRRRRHVADGHLRSRARHALLADRQSRRR